MHMKTALKYALGALLPALLSSQAAACYTVYNRNNQVLYNAAVAPVDMRYQIHQTLPAVYPGGHLVFSVTDTACPALNRSRDASANAAVNSMPGRVSYSPSPGEAVTPGRSATTYTVIRP